MQYGDVVDDFLRLVREYPKRPDLVGLTRLAKAFHRLPYENLTKIIRYHEAKAPTARLRMPDVVLADHVDLGTGGTCFSLTYFFQQILLGVGFDVYPVLCDRSYGPNTHCAVVVRLEDGDYLVDPGYLMEAPLLLPPHGQSIQDGRLTRMTLVRLGDTSQLILATERNGKSRIRYRFKDAPVSSEDFLRRWMESFDWAMMRHICISRHMDEKQVFMRDGVMRCDTGRGKDQRSIKDNFADAVEGTFGIKGRLVLEAHDCIQARLKSEGRRHG
jgi:arylamine N-acetyltransferase